jgi:ABC-type branched-subunit amino acid transport system ATPase component
MPDPVTFRTMTESGNGRARAGAPAIEVRSLTKSFGELEAVRGVDFEVAAGEVFGFLGPNGAGKTTTMRIVLGAALGVGDRP